MEELASEPSIPLVSLTEFEGGNQCPTWHIPNISFLKDKRLSLLPKLLKKWSENEVEDLTLTLGTRKLGCNRLLLMCHSEYALRKLKNGQRELILPEDRVTWKGLKLICEWMKKSSELLQRRNIVTLLSTAIFLEIEHLVKHIWYCLDLYDEFQEDQAFVVSQEALELHSNMPIMRLDIVMLRRICCFFLTLVSSHEFVELSIEQVCALLNSDRLAVNSEKEVFFAAIRWLTHNWPTRIQHIAAVLQVIRLPLLLRKTLQELRQPTDDQVFNLVIAQFEYQQIMRTAISNLAIISNNDSSEIYKLHCNTLKISTPVRRLFICHDLCPYHRHHSDESLGDFNYQQFLSYLQVLQKSPNSWKCLKAEQVPFTFK